MYVFLFTPSPIRNIVYLRVVYLCFALWAFLIVFSCRIGMARMDTVDLSSGSEVYTPDVEEVNLIVSNHLLTIKHEIWI